MPAPGRAGLGGDPGRGVVEAEFGGELAPGLDAAAEAARLLALSHGLRTSVLVGQRSAAADMAMLHYHLDLLCSRCATATTQAAHTAEAGAT